jgi:hypothetical protein
MKGLRNKVVRFKTNIIHKAEATNHGVYYRCNHAVGALSEAQLLHKTNWKIGSHKITCKNCRKRYLHKR